MKINWNSRYNTIAAYVLLTSCIGILFFLGISNISKVAGTVSKGTAVFQPFVYGFALAYVLNFVLKFYENKVIEKIGWMKKLKTKKKRVFGLIFTYVSFGLVIYLFVIFVVPQLAESTMGLINDVPSSVYKAGNLINDMIKDLQLDPQAMKRVMEQWEKFVNYVLQIMTNLIPLFASMVKVIASSVWNIVIGFIVSIYLLADKERFNAICKKMTYAIFKKKRAFRIFELTERTNSIFGRFIVGKLLDSLIIGILTFIVLTIVRMPYTILISVIIGITNIIPFFGPFIGAIPSILIVLFVSPINALWLIIIIFVIQQIDGNIIGPKILGDSIGISAFWILFSLLIAGKLFGIPGMVIGVPLFAVIYSIVKDIIEEKLDKKGLPIETSRYMNTQKYDYVENEEEE